MQYEIELKRIYQIIGLGWFRNVRRWWWRPQNGPGSMYLWKADHVMKERPPLFSIWHAREYLVNLSMEKEPMFMTGCRTMKYAGQEIIRVTIGLDIVPGDFRRVSTTMAIYIRSMD
ncbi:MAG: hypothetical protein NUV80_06945 [Candidatus Berkelbacteria bacterium]|nr:hypothetical protein [Candidatus Berkelbacteria bacterium]